MTATFTDLATGRTFLLDGALPGRDAYDEAVARGFQGDREAWLASLRGFAFDPVSPDWDAGRTYPAYAAVRHLNALWVAVAPSTGVIPGTDPAAWTILIDGSGVAEVFEGLGAFAPTLLAVATAAAARAALELGTAATAASAELLARANHTGTQPVSTLTGQLPVANGGTGASNAAAARGNLGLGTAATAASAELLARANHTGTQPMSTLTGQLPIANGGTGAANVAQARDNLELGTAARANVIATPADATPDRVLTTGASATLLAASPALRVAYGGTANAIALTTGAGLSGTPPTGLALRFRATAANTGATTIALDGGSPIACRTVTGVALPSGYVRTGVETEAVFDGTFWVLRRAPEEGSNANGAFLRLETGWMEVTKTITGLGPIDTAAGALFSLAGNASVGALAAAFAAAPARLISAGSPSLSAIAAGVSAPGLADGGSFTLLRVTATANTGFVANLTFTGRWY